MEDKKCYEMKIAGNVGSYFLQVVPLPPDGKYWAMCDETPLDLQSDGADSFFECPHCGEKKIIAIDRPKEGPFQYTIISWK